MVKNVLSTIKMSFALTELLITLTASEPIPDPYMWYQKVIVQAALDAKYLYDVSSARSPGVPHDTSMNM